MKTRLYSIFLVAIALAFFFPLKVLAASLTLSSDTSQLTQSDTFTVSVNLSLGVADGTVYYLRGAFYQPNTTNYCGYTWNTTSWYNGPYTTNNGWQNVLPIQIHNSSWSGQLLAKIDAQDSGCSASGTYNFKIERFTTSGSSSWDSQNELSVAVVIPTPTPTPMPTPTPTPVPTNTPIPTTKPSSTNLPTKIVTTSLITTTLSPTISESSSSAVASETAILGTEEFATPSATSVKKSSGMNWLATLALGVGMLILICCGILLYQKYQKRKYSEDEVSYEKL